MARKELPRRIPTGDMRIFHRTEWREADTARIVLEVLIDRSASMAGDKMDAARRTSIALCRMSEKFEMPLGIHAFAGDNEQIKKFSQSYEDRAEKIKPKLMLATTRLGGSTNISDPLEIAGEELHTELRRTPDAQGVIFLITDSDANSGVTGDALKEQVQELQRQHVVVNFLLGASPNEVEKAKRLFGENNVVAPQSFAALPSETARVLTGLFRRLAQRYAQH